MEHRTDQVKLENYDISNYPSDDSTKLTSGNLSQKDYQPGQLKNMLNPMMIVKDSVFVFLTFSELIKIGKASKLFHETVWHSLMSKSVTAWQHDWTCAYSDSDEQFSSINECTENTWTQKRYKTVLNTINELVERKIEELIKDEYKPIPTYNHETGMYFTPENIRDSVEIQSLSVHDTEGGNQAMNTLIKNMTKVISYNAFGKSAEAKGSFSKKIKFDVSNKFKDDVYFKRKTPPIVIAAKQAISLHFYLVLEWFLYQKNEGNMHGELFVKSVEMKTRKDDGASRYGPVFMNNTVKALSVEYVEGNQHISLATFVLEVLYHA